jgi:hypothetical protein
MARKSCKISVAAAKQLYRTKSLAGVGFELGCSAATVRRALIDAGVPIRTRGRPKND